jgi:photosystem II stability/assembly factor-like uncharacterized protein
MYLGTGEASAGLVGVGAFKSVDGGVTWAYLASTNADATPDWRFVNRLAIHPAQPQVLLAALTNNNLATGAIYRSADSGANWVRVSAFKALDIAFDPVSPANAIAGLDDGTIAFSRDAGVTWAKTAALVATPSGRQGTARAEIAFARSQPGVAYASVDNEKGEVWRSSDSGATWVKLSTPAHLGAQGDYDNAIWVDPTDAAHLVVAGLDAYQSRDGGVTFTQVSDCTTRRPRRIPTTTHWSRRPTTVPRTPCCSTATTAASTRRRTSRDDELRHGGHRLVERQQRPRGHAVLQRRGAHRGRRQGRRRHAGQRLAGARCRRLATVRGGDGGFSAVDPPRT